MMPEAKRAEGRIWGYRLSRMAWRCHHDILLPRNRYTGKENTPGKPHRGRAGDLVRGWLLALFGPVAVRVKSAAPVVPGVVASVAGGDDAAA